MPSIQKGRVALPHFLKKILQAFLLLKKDVQRTDRFQASSLAAVAKSAVRFNGDVFYRRITLELKAGEILALIGENGAGKSTLIKCCSGAVIPTSGKIIVNGKEFSSMTPQLASENGIAIIYQEFNNVKELSAAENLFLGHPIRKGMIVDKKAMEAEAAKAFEQLHIKIDPKALMKDLTVGYQQMVEIAKAIQQNARILIMDEPSAPLTSAEVESMFEVVELLRK